MNKKQYNNIIEHSLQYDCKDTGNSLDTARTVFYNMGVALPQGTMKEVYAALKTNDYMGWRSCTMQEAQEAADNGTAAIGISESRIVVLAATDEEEPVETTAEVMSITESTPAVAVAQLQYYAYNYGTTAVCNYPIWVCYQTENNCYVAGTPIGTIQGIVVHSTGANNPNLKRYVDAPTLVGTNTNGNHWNQPGINKMVHAFIGLDKDGDVTIINTLPYEFACWGVGSGSLGSYNFSPNAHIQFEICEDALTDAEYFNKAVMGAAVDYCAYLCRRFNLSVDTIVSHREAYLAGYGSNHGDPNHWLNNFGVTMDNFRSAVQNKLCGCC